MSIKDGGPFHPLTINRRAEGGVIVECDVYTGASLRDHFAGLAMQGLLANEDARLMAFDECSRVAYEHADSMIRAREAGQ